MLNADKLTKNSLPFFSIQYMVYWLSLHPGVSPSGLVCYSPLEYAGESVEEYVKAYNRECPKQQSRPDQDQTDPKLWNTLMEAQAELEEEELEEEELEPSALRVPQKYQIIRLSWLKLKYEP